MKSFGLGKKQARGETPKRLTRPTNADLTQLLTSAQKNPEKSFNIIWPSAAFKDWNYVLSVINSTAGKDRRGWASSAVDKAAIGEAEWKLNREHNMEKIEVFTMPSSDTFLIQTLIDEALQNESDPMAGGVESPGGIADFGDSSDAPPASPAGKSEGPAKYGGADANSSHPKTPPPAMQEGNLRRTDIKTLLKNYAESKTTGRLLCDGGTMQAEVFMMNGQPVHAKSCHSFYDDRDIVGDSVLVDLLTWREGTYKFQDGWPAASKSITSTLEAFLNGEVVVAPAPPPDIEPAPVSPPPPPVEPPPPPPQPMAQPPLAGAAPPEYKGAPAAFVDDFSNVDELIGEIYSGLVEDSGYLKFGMFLMLARGEFVRHEVSKVPFCIASIGLELPTGPLSMDALKAVGECFEPVCQTLDCLGYANPNQLFALFPQSSAATAAMILKHFVNNVLTTPLDAINHGSTLKVTVGLCEVSRDGSEFEEVLARTSQLRKLATAERKVVTLA